MGNSQESFRPSQVVFVDVDSTIAKLTGDHANGKGERYQQAYVFVRLHDEPIGTVQVDIPDNGLAADDLANTIWQELGHAINAHLKDDELSEITGLSGSGIGKPAALPCWEILDDNLPMVSIVIPTRDRADELERNLHTILALEGPSFEVIVVDNASKTDATERMVRESFAHDRRVQYLGTPIPGISHARNRGSELAKGEIIAYTDDDVVVDRNWLRAIVRGFLRSPQADLLTGLVLPAALETQPQFWFEEFGGFNKGFRPRLFTKQRQPEDPALYPYTAGSYGTGNNIAIRKETLERIGWFDERLGVGTPAQGGEDLDTFLGVIINGGAIAYEPAAIINHFHREDYEGLKKQLFNYGVGLTALYTKWLFRHPLDILRRVPPGLWFLFNPKSKKNEQRSTDFPRDLITTELRGMLYGPVAYFKSVRSKKKAS